MPKRVGIRSPRLIRPYPKKSVPMVKRRGRPTVVRWSQIRLDRPRIHARSWRYRTRLDPRMALEDRAAQEIRGSLEERIFYKALTDYGFIPGIDFSFQTAMLGGRAELGGMVADFLFESIKLIINPSSVWHTMTLANIERDADQTSILRGMGYEQLLLDPFIIHDANLLDEWIEANLLPAFGLSSRLGNSGASSVTFMQDMEKATLNRILLTTDAILLELK